MPKITNIHDMPDQFVNYAKKRRYSRGRSNTSITSLIDAPQIDILKHAYEKDIVVDASEMMWSMLGVAVHNLLERQETVGNVEKRLFHETQGWVVSGQPDISYNGDTVIINDHKTTTAYNAGMEDHPSWDAQLNGYDWLYRHVRMGGARYPAVLQISAVIRDWRQIDVDKYDNYPKAPMIVIPVKRWTYDEQDDYYEKRITAHQEAMGAWMTTRTPPPCTDEQMWRKDVRYSIWGGTGKRAIKNFDNEKEATAALKVGQWMTEEGGEYTRCDRFCEVREFCPQKKARDDAKEASKA
jgi:hypothetical protein